MIAGLTGISSSSYALADDGLSNCPQGEINCAYPGNCGRYLDTNNDGICDDSQSAPWESPEKLARDLEVTESYRVSQDLIAADDSESSAIGSNAGNIKTGYYLIPILLLVGILYGLSYLLSAIRIIRPAVHRKIWNLMLLVTTVISAVLGLILILKIDFSVNISLPFNILFWHVEAGIAMGMIAVFHILWHWRYFQKIFKFADYM